MRIAVTFVRSDNHYLLIRRCSKYLPGNWQMVTGKVEDDEKIWQAALRELNEETSLTPRQFYSADCVETYYDRNRDQVFANPVFLALVDRDQIIKLSPTEHDQYGWFTFDEALEKLEFIEHKRLLKTVHENTPNERLLISTAEPEAVLETERLVLKHMSLEDDLSAIFSDPEVMKYSLSGVLDRERTKLMIQFLVNQRQRFGMSLCSVFLKETNQLIGMCGIFQQTIDGIREPELGYRFAKAYWGKGYAFEAANALKHYLFDKLGYTSLYSFVEEENERSVRLVEKMGGTLFKEILYEDVPVSVYVYR